MTDDNVMKIADFGLARDVHNIDYYKKTTNVSSSTIRPAGPVLGTFLKILVRTVSVREANGLLWRRSEQSVSVPPHLGWADPCGSVVAGSSAREMDGPGGSVRPGLHTPERRVSLHKRDVAFRLSAHVRCRGIPCVEKW